MVAVQAKVGKDAWDKMTEEEREAKYKTYRGDCWNHLRNIIIQAMATVSATCTLNASLHNNMHTACHHHTHAFVRHFRP
jgi:hypothetical protein